jgi:ankyrin repeat protein
MFKKVPAIILAMMISGSGVAFANDTTTDVRDSRDEKTKVVTTGVIDYNDAFFKNEDLNAEQKVFQEKAITNLKKKYLDAKNYNEEELNNLFTSFISLGLNDAADAILNDKNVKIDLNRYNTNGLTPLMAAAITPMKGGNVEYAKKLIDLGVDINKGTKNADVSPMSLASTMNNYKVVAVLIFNGALFMKEDKMNFRPIDYALRNNSLESAQIIKEALTQKLSKIRKEKEAVK